MISVDGSVVAVSRQEWAEAALATYSQGDVCYMVLEMDPEPTETRWSRDPERKP